uniref:Bifunctional inhibitor/plant lipid transfer protein/seed storage helical domain-containing protein n=1 Tax=Oryza brachyantha TaxID=4533 RepID=J3LJ65_ORYBR
MAKISRPRTVAIGINSLPYTRGGISQATGEAAARDDADGDDDEEGGGGGAGGGGGGVQLTVCAGAIAGGAKPTAACCSSLRAQQGCFCQFAKDPRYGRYVNSPNARRAVTSCGIAVPRCH